jgi:Spirocyclase AveC-like
VPWLIIVMITTIRWLAAGPHAITKYRHGHPVDFWAAHIGEVLMAVVAILVTARVVKGCREQKKFLTLEVMWLIAATTVPFSGVNGAPNFFLPMFTYTSNFVNLNDPCGQIPFVPNRHCGTIPNPVVFLGLMEVFGFLGAAMLFRSLATRLRKHHPHLSPANLAAIVMTLGCLTVIGEPLLIIPLHLWEYPGAPLSIPTWAGHGYGYPIFPEILAFGLVFGISASIYAIRDDHGLTAVERGLAHHRPWVRKTVTVMALFTTIQVASWVPGNGFIWMLGFHQHRWTNLPAQLNNGLCNQPSVGRTPYGPCPGTPGFRMPLG